MKTLVVLPMGAHPFHTGHMALYNSAKTAFPDSDVYIAATNDTSTRPFPFAVKQKLAKLSGVPENRFIPVKSPFRADEITKSYDPADTQLIFVRSEKDADKPPVAGGMKKDGTPAYLQPISDVMAPMTQHAYMVYLPTVEFGPGMTSATEIRSAWPTLNQKRKTALVMSLYPKTQSNPKLAATVVKMLDTAMGAEAQDVAEGALDEGVNDPHIFKAIAMIGPMGAGKSTIARQLVGGSGLRSLNLDNFNELLIKQGKVAGGNLTPDQLERSWQLTQAQKSNWVTDRLGLLIDGSGRNVEGLVKPLTDLEKLGYNTMVILVNVSLDTSLQRQQARAAQQTAQYGTGRNVPLDLAKSSYEQIQQNIPKLQQLYGNRLLIINNEGAVDLSQEQSIVSKFLNSPPSSPAAVQWIKSHGQAQGQQLDNRLAQQQRQAASAQRAPAYKSTTLQNEDKKELPQWKKDWYAQQKPNSWPKHPQPYHNPEWIDELSPEERKKLANQEVDEAGQKFVDPELYRTQQYAKQHYPGMADPESAFDKWVSRSLMHSDKDDHDQDKRLQQLAKEITALKAKIQSLQQTADYLDESR
jgi:adenylate kinase family enzyme